MGAGRQGPQHPSGVVGVDRFAEDLAVDLDDRVGGEHDDITDAIRPVDRLDFVEGQAAD